MNFAFEDLLVKVAELQLNCSELIAEGFEAQTNTILFHDSFGSKTEHLIKAYDFIAPFLAGLVPNFLHGVKVAYITADDKWIETPTVNSEQFTMDTFHEHPLWTSRNLTAFLAPEIWLGDLAVRLKFHPMTTLIQVQSQIRKNLKRVDIDIKCQPEQLHQTLLAYEAGSRPIMLASAAEDVVLHQVYRPLPEMRFITVRVNGKSIIAPDCMVWTEFKRHVYADRLVKNGLLIVGKENQTLSQVGVQADDELKEEHSGLQISVKTFMNTTLIISVDSTDSVELLKQMLEERTGVDADQVRLVYGGKQLEDYRTLADYNIGDMSTVHMYLRLRGGMYHITSGRKGYAGIKLKCQNKVEWLQQFLQLNQGNNEEPGDFVARCRSEINRLRQLIQTGQLEPNQDAKHKRKSKKTWDTVDSEFQHVKSLILELTEPESDLE